MNIPGLGEVGSIDFGGIISTVVKIGALFFLLVLTGIMAFSIFWLRNRKKLDNKKIFWFEEVNGSFIPIDEDKARELTIPGSNIQVFYIKKKDLYLPRLVKRMGKDAYWLGIKNNREIVNFTMKNINDKDGKAGIEYDHTDMRYALTNLKDLIKRNYRDNSKPWWREYKEVISLIILVFVLTMSFVFLMYQLGGLIGQIGTLMDKADIIIKTAGELKGSGVRPA